MEHRCNKLKLFLLEWVEFEEDTYELKEVPDTIDPIQHQAELLIISLHALAGVPSPKTMRLVGHIGKQSVIILIYTGSNTVS